MQNTEVENVVREILGLRDHPRAASPDFLAADYDDIKALAGLLLSNPQEEQLQKFLEARPGILLGLFGDLDTNTLAFLVKPPIGTLYKADFAVIEIGQGGGVIHLVEIEPCHFDLFIGDGSESSKLRHAIGQVRDWQRWIETGSNKSTFVKDTLDRAKLMPTFPRRATNNSFVLREPEEIEKLWQSFSGYELPFISLTVVIGRWSKLSQNHRKNLIFRNQSERSFCRVCTWDQVARISHGKALRIPPQCY